MERTADPYETDCIAVPLSKLHASLCAAPQGR